MVISSFFAKDGIRIKPLAIIDLALEIWNIFPDKKKKNKICSTIKNIDITDVKNCRSNGIFLRRLKRLLERI